MKQNPTHSQTRSRPARSKECAGLDTNRLHTRRSFPLGRIQVTPTAAQRVSIHFILVALGRHAAGDWGQVSAAQRKRNEKALRQGGPLFSAYTTPGGVKLWVTTGAYRVLTAILLPEDEDDLESF